MENKKKIEKVLDEEMTIRYTVDPEGTQYVACQDLANAFRNIGQVALAETLEEVFESAKKDMPKKGHASIFKH
jgi:hypothetical protein